METEDATVQALKMEEEAMSQGTQVASRSWERQKMESLIEPPEETQSCQRFDFNPVRLISELRPPEL